MNGLTEITVIDQGQDSPITTPARLAAAGQAANRAAAAHVFEDYSSRKAANTRERQAGDLANFADFLAQAGVPVGDLATDPESWRGVTWGLLEAFKRWALAAGFAVSSINVRLSTIKSYAKLAAKAGAIDQAEAALIQTVSGYSRQEAKHLDEQRRAEETPTRKGTKKGESVTITPDQARRLKSQPDTPQGRRDALLMCVLLDHGLRCGEVALLRVEQFEFTDFKAGSPTRGFIHFERPKVGKVQTHRMTPDTLAATWAYLQHDQPMQTGPLFLATRKGGMFTGLGLSERAITKRVEYLGRAAGLAGLSAHDARHFWATDAARNNTPIDRLMDAGGWSSPSMPMRYIERARVANDGVKLTGS